MLAALPERAHVLDQSARRGVGIVGAAFAQRRHERPGQRFAEFDTPLVKGIDAAQDALNKGPMLVQRLQLTKSARVKLR